MIHVEAPNRPDGMRLAGGALRDRDRWWEYGGFFLATNTNKRGLTLDLADPRGLALAKRLVERCDAVVENFTPRVLDGFGLGWDAIRAANPRAVLVRMPAFGLSGPWRDRPGFAQTLEQLSGMAWLTGHRDDQPRIQRGPCDPMAGMHAAFALLAALLRRERTGRGAQVECAMLEVALNAAAESILEFGATGNVLEREGNRAPEAAPQGLYPCRGSRPGAEHWLALSVATDAQWRALVDVLGRPDWSGEPALGPPRGTPRRPRPHRRRAPVVGGGARARPAGRGAGGGGASPPGACSIRAPRAPIPSSWGGASTKAWTIPSSAGIPTPPCPSAMPAWGTGSVGPAPTFGEHNREILDELGVDAEEQAQLAAEGVISERPILGDSR